MTEFEFQVDSTDLAFRAGLERWLLEDDRLRGSLRLNTTSPRQSSAHNEYLGDPLSILAVVLSTVLGLPAFLDSVRRWFATQPPQTPPLTLTRGTVTVLIPQGMDAAGVAELADALSSAEPPQPVDDAPEGPPGPAST
ncbi:effector-associated constant component EACC1 [Streptomyces hirsutus]|uniref:effector-associated constant component EACC1 n=1 Tax=Streptomyces hirsutus TaxID=35620 RepID=UPI0033334E76